MECCISVAVRSTLWAWSATACGCSVIIPCWCVVVRTSGSLVQVGDGGHVFCCESLIIVLTQFIDFWTLPPVGVKVVRAHGRVSTFHLLQIDGRSLYRRLSKKKIQACLECPYDPHRQQRWDVLLHDSVPPAEQVGSCLRYNLRNPLSAPFSLEAVLLQHFAPLFQLLFPDECFLSVSIPQDLCRVESDERPRCPNNERSLCRVSCCSDEPFRVVFRSPCTSVVHFVVARSSVSFWTLVGPVSEFAASCAPGTPFELLDTRALPTWSLLSATSTTPRTERTAGFLCSI